MLGHCPLAHQPKSQRSHVICPACAPRRVENGLWDFREVLHGCAHYSSLQQVEIERRPCAIAQQ